MKAFEIAMLGLAVIAIAGIQTQYQIKSSREYADSVEGKQQQMVADCQRSDNKAQAVIDGPTGKFLGCWSPTKRYFKYDGKSVYELQKGDR